MPKTDTENSIPEFFLRGEVLVRIKEGKQTILNATRQYPSIRPGASTCCYVNRETKQKERKKRLGNVLKAVNIVVVGLGGR